MLPVCSQPLFLTSHPSNPGFFLLFSVPLIFHFVFNKYWSVVNKSSKLNRVNSSYFGNITILLLDSQLFLYWYIHIILKLKGTLELIWYRWSNQGLDFMVLRSGDCFMVEQCLILEHYLHSTLKYSPNLGLCQGVCCSRFKCTRLLSHAPLI